MSQLNGPKGDSFVRCQAYRKGEGLLPSGEGVIEWNPGAGTTSAPKMALALVLEQAEGRGLKWGKGGVKLLLKFVARPCQPGLWG